MRPSVRTFFSGIIDYAGLFPPAQLPLDEAVRNYARYATGPESWMLGRFVCPAARLAELSRHLSGELVSAVGSFGVSVLATNGHGAAEFATNIRADLATIAGFKWSHTEVLVGDLIEARLPASVVSAGEEAVRSLLAGVAEALRIAAPPFMASTATIYYEAGLKGDWRAAIAATVKGLAGHNAAAARDDGRPVVGLKLRCGGLEASAYPSAEQVAYVLTACRDAAVPLKCTAGLHHPVRRLDRGTGIAMHGFLNVFGAGVLAHAQPLTEEQVREIVADEEPSHFAFDDGGFCWQGVRAGVDEIAAARRLVTSFGSCSFDEPCDGLRALGLLQ